VQVKDSLSFQILQMRDHITVWPATQYMQDLQDVKNILMDIESEMNVRVKQLEQQGKLAEAQRLQKRVLYDTKMIAETGFVNGIENYSPYFEKRLDGSPPNTLFDYFPDDFLLIVDESHMTLPQLRAMPQGDFSRKTVLIEHGFRLPTAIHHRPIKFEELSYVL
jgi:excinuclease ABC subunit B